MDFFLHYLSFLLNTATIVIAIIIVLITIVALAARNKLADKDQVTIKK